MSDEASKETRTDILDLIISFLVEHEKQLDTLAAKLENLVGEKTRGFRRDEFKIKMNNKSDQPCSFTLRINNPDNFGNIKSVKIDLE